MNTVYTAGQKLAHAIVATTHDIRNQLHGSAKSYRHYAPLFRKFAEQDKPFMLVKVMATPRRNVRVPEQAAFFSNKEEMIAASIMYRTTDIRENGLDVLFVDMFEWDLGINHIPNVELN